MRRAGGKGYAYWNENLRFLVGGKTQARGEALLVTKAHNRAARSFSDFSLRLEITTYDAPIDAIVIPVIRDQLDLAHAKVAKGYSLEFIGNK